MVWWAYDEVEGDRNGSRIFRNNAWVKKYEAFKNMFEFEAQF